MHRPIKSILVVKNRAMGDAILTLGAIQYLKEIFPTSHITYLVPDWILPLFKEVKTAADTIEGMRFWPLSSLVETWSQLLGKNFDLILEFNQSGKGKKFLNLFSFVKNVPYFYHNHHLPTHPKSFVFRQGEIQANIQRDLDLCFSVLTKYLSLPLPLPSYLHYTPKISLLKQGPNKKNILLGVVASRETKMYPLNYWPKLIELLLTYNPKLTFVIPLSRSLQDEVIQKELSSKLGNNSQVSFVQKELNELPRLVSSTRCYIGNDTGIKHLAISMGIPTLSFFGPEGPKEWHPYDVTRHPYLFLEPLECRTKVAHYCGLNQCESMVCLNTFTPQKVFSTLQAMNFPIA